MNILIEVRCTTTSWPEEEIRSLALFALEQEEAPATCEVSISLVDIDEMAELNSSYRGKNGPTDVLSFPLDDAWDDEEGEWAAPADEDDTILLGDIIIAPAVALEQAPQYGNSFDAEMSLLLVHGILHLLGYDHIDDEEAEEMEAREAAILHAWDEARHE